jgi:NAD(P)-dependent dehydrogenase (short-subunit alcohol dehydrogenase family)
MHDQVVVVTGATGLLGPVVARRFADAGARLALLAREEESCIGVAMGLPGALKRHIGVPVDLADVISAEAAADTVRERLGPASILLHLVGGYIGGTSLVDTSDDEWRGQLDLNLMSTVNAVRAFLPDIAKATHGRVITTSSIRTAAPTAGHAPYAATKAAVEALTISVAKDLAGTTATANVIQIGAIGSEKPSQTRPEELAAAMAWLCSADGGAVNGQRIPVTGRS